MATILSRCSSVSRLGSFVVPLGIATCKGSSSQEHPMQTEQVGCVMQRLYILHKRCSLGNFRSMAGPFPTATGDGALPECAAIGSIQVLFNCLWLLEHACTYKLMQAIFCESRGKTHVPCSQSIISTNTSISFRLFQSLSPLSPASWYLAALAVIA
jgi:hypothetical protein